MICILFTADLKHDLQYSTVTGPDDGGREEGEEREQLEPGQQPLLHQLCVHLPQMGQPYSGAIERSAASAPQALRSPVTDGSTLIPL